MQRMKIETWIKYPIFGGKKVSSSLVYASEATIIPEPTIEETLKEAFLTCPTRTYLYRNFLQTKIPWNGFCSFENRSGGVECRKINSDNLFHEGLVLALGSQERKKFLRLASTEYFSHFPKKSFWKMEKVLTFFTPEKNFFATQELSRLLHSTDCFRQRKAWEIN